MTRDILSSLDYDDVSSINETDEALQVARVIKESFEYIIDQYSLRDEEALFNVSNFSSNVIGTLPSNVSRVYAVKYDTSNDPTGDIRYSNVTYLEPSDFLKITDSRSSTATNTDELTLQGTKTFIYNDRQPLYYTTFDNHSVVFDAYNSSVDASGLVSAKTKLMGATQPSFSMTDSFSFPELSDSMISFLYNESKSLAWQELKETTTQRTENRRRKQEIRTQKTDDKIHQRPRWYGKGRS